MLLVDHAVPKNTALQRSHGHPAGLQAEVHVREAQQRANSTTCGKQKHDSDGAAMRAAACAPAWQPHNGFSSDQYSGNTACHTSDDGASCDRSGRHGTMTRGGAVSCYHFTIYRVPLIHEHQWIRPGYSGFIDASSLLMRQDHVASHCTPAVDPARCDWRSPRRPPTFDGQCCHSLAAVSTCCDERAARRQPRRAQAAQHSHVGPAHNWVSGCTTLQPLVTDRPRQLPALASCCAVLRHWRPRRHRRWPVRCEGVHRHQLLH